MRRTVTFTTLFSLAFANPVSTDTGALKQCSGPEGVKCDKGFKCTPSPVCLTGWAGLDECPAYCQPKSTVPPPRKLCNGIMPVVCDLPSECIPEAACVEKYGGPGPCPKYCELPADSSSQTLPIPTPSLDPIFLAPRLERHPARDEIFHCGPYPQPDGPTISTECPENLRCICYANSLPRPEGEICKGFCQRPEDVLPPPPNPTPATGTPIPRAIHAKRQNPAYPSSSITYTPSPGPTPDSSLRLEAGINESCEGHITETRCAKGLKCIKEGECIPSGIDDCSGTCEPTDQNDVFKG